MARPLQFGILSCARIGRRGMIHGIQNSGNAQLVGIASLKSGKARNWALEFGIPKSYESYDELIADRDIDAVYIPLPNELHKPWVVRAADAGKHILCEKPLALNAAEAEEMVDHCRRRGVLLMEAFMWRHHPRVERARRQIDTGELGELRLVKMDFSFNIDRDDWRLDPQRGGGAMWDLGCYGINAARFFTREEPTEVHVRGVPSSSGVDMTAGIQLKFPGGAVALLDCSFECPYRNRLEIVGTKMALEFPEGVLPAPQAELAQRTDSGTDVHFFEPANQYALQVKTFANSVMAGKLLDPAEDGLANMRVLDRAWADFHRKT